MIKIAIVTGYDEGYAQLGNVSSQNHAAYAAHCGYDLHIHRQGFDTNRPASWSKILFFQQHLDHYDWLFWIDTDALFMRKDIRIESFIDRRNCLFLEAENAGVFLLRCGYWAEKFLNCVWEQTQFINHHWWEGQAISHLLRTQQWVRDYRKEMPPHSFNCFYDYKEGDFVLHLAGVGPTLEDRAKLLQKYARPA